MRAMDFSANKCYPLVMPNLNDNDPRRRLDVRSGASINISNSRIFVFGGCVFELDLPANFKLDTIHKAFVDGIKKTENIEDVCGINFNQYLSSECFRLSLINRKWHHYDIAEGSDKPPTRMFHNMIIYNNCIYISGGLRFNEENNLVVLNDLWRFNLFEKSWRCYYKNNNDRILKRYDHLSAAFSEMELFDKSLVNPGICIVGGMSEEDEIIEKAELFDLMDDDLKVQTLPNLLAFDKLMNGSIPKGHPVKIRGSTCGMFSAFCSTTNEEKLFVFDESPNLSEYEPILMFRRDAKGIRYPKNNGFDTSPIGKLSFPRVGYFGTNMIIMGFAEDDKKISAYMYNVRVNTWTKLHISCLHKIYTHKLTVGFVWSSHHKNVFLGSSVMKESGGSVNYFDTLMVLALPFTNFFGNDSRKVLDKELNGNIPTSQGAGIQKQRQGKSETSVFDFFHQSNNPNEHSGGFADYAYHVAQQLPLNYICYTLPPHAIAIGKHAFERNTSFSDLDLVCCDGSTISVPYALCRRRWGIGFDEILSDAYAKSYVEGKSQSLRSSQGSVHESRSSMDEYSSLHSKSSSATPNFRYPFQDKKDRETTTTTTGVTANTGLIPTSGLSSAISPVRNTPRNSSANSRHHSLSGSLFPNTTLSRASISLSQSRRNSYNPMSRTNSISGSRRSSLGNTGLPRRNSPIIQHSRRASTLSRNSFSIGNTNSNSNSININGATNNSHMSPHSSIEEVPRLSPPVTNNSYKSFGEFGRVGSNSSYSGDSRSSSSTHSDGSSESIPSGMQDAINNYSIPPPKPMPTQPPEDDIKDSTILSDSSEDCTFSKQDIDNSIIDLVYQQFQDENNINIDPLRIPRALYIPYSNATVHAIVEFLYSGHIGANWKLFPTGIELLMASKQLGIPLLYDLVMEIFFVILGTMESKLKNDLILYLEHHADGEGGADDERIDRIYDILDREGGDDMDMDIELLLEAASQSRRDSGTTISSDMKLDGDEEFYNGDFGPNCVDDDCGNSNSYHCMKPRKDSTMNGIDPLEVDPREEGNMGRGTLDRYHMMGNGSDEGNKGSRGSSDCEGGEESGGVTITTGMLEERGYETSDSSDNEEGEVLMSSFKNFSLTGGDSGRNLASEGGEARECSNRKKGHITAWPTFKDLIDINSDVHSCTNASTNVNAAISTVGGTGKTTSTNSNAATNSNANGGEYHGCEGDTEAGGPQMKLKGVFIELFVEAGALVNDSKLMLQAIYVLDLYKKFTSLKNTGSVDATNGTKDKEKQKQQQQQQQQLHPMNRSKSTNSTSKNSTVDTSLSNSELFGEKLRGISSYPERGAPSMLRHVSSAPVNEVQQLRFEREAEAEAEGYPRIYADTYADVDADVDADATTGTKIRTERDTPVVTKVGVKAKTDTGISAYNAPLKLERSDSLQREKNEKSHRKRKTLLSRLRGFHQGRN